MEPLTLKIPPRLAAELEAFARSRGASRSAVVREAIKEYLGRARTPSPASCLDLARDLVGTVEGPRDLATNPRHLKDYGR
ncbi:MAG TPA: CopG family transcriptional regulator [Gemmatimonadales bacterium]|jgi:Arc/MetJ-type ribon-helix-helix transcriptional regulator